MVHCWATIWSKRGLLTKFQSILFLYLKVRGPSLEWWKKSRRQILAPISLIGIWVFPKIMVPQIIHFNRGFHYKPSILGYPYFWKHPYVVWFFVWWRFLAVLAWVKITPILVCCHWANRNSWNSIHVYIYICIHVYIYNYTYTYTYT